MADFDNIPIEVSAEDLENVAKRPYKIVARPPTGLDTGETGQWWIEIDNETEEVVQIYQRVGFKWVSYLNDETKIVGLKLKDEISVEDLLTTLDVYPLIFGSDPPTSSTKGYAKQMYFDIENATFYVCRGLVGSGYLWEKAFTSGGGGGNIDLSDYVPTSRKIADIDLKDDITVEELMEKLSINQKWNQIVLTPPTSNVTDDYLATLVDENWIGFWQGSVYINYKYISGSLTFYYQHRLSFNTSDFRANSRYGIRHYEGADIIWYEWTSTQNNSLPYRRQYQNRFSSLFAGQLKITSNSSADNSGYQISTVFAKVEVPQTDETTGAELPIGNYFMVGDIANNQIGCWSLTDNQSYTITRTKDESGTWHYSVTSSKSYIDEKIGDIDTALDELHAYAQGLISGGDEV